MRRTSTWGPALWSLLPDCTLNRLLPLRPRLSLCEGETRTDAFILKWLSWIFVTMLRKVANTSELPFPHSCPPAGSMIRQAASPASGWRQLSSLSSSPHCSCSPGSSPPFPVQTLALPCPSVTTVHASMPHFICHSRPSSDLHRGSR